jgi:hypothetical protein
MSFENSGLNGDFPVKVDLIGNNAFHTPHGPVFGIWCKVTPEETK